MDLVGFGDRPIDLDEDDFVALLPQKVPSS